MKKTILSLTLVAMLLMAMMPAALADSTSFSGTVVAQTATYVSAPIGGKVQSVSVSEGQRVNVGDTLASLETTKVYAEQAGTVTGVFGVEGDSVSALDSQYGGVLYMEPAVTFTVSASTAKAYNDDANKMIHVGEKVYMTSYSDTKRTGEGIVTSVSGFSYTVEVTSGELELSESVVIYRKPSYESASRLGRGTTARTDPFAVTGTGSIVNVHVKAGQTVQKGDLLFETLDGTFDGMVMSGSNVASTVSGIVKSVNVASGDTIAKGATIVTVYQDSDMRIEAQVPEGDLDVVQEGDTVDIEFNWNDTIRIRGTVERISAIGVESTTESGTVYYNATVSFVGDAQTRYGMNVTVSTLDAAVAAQ